MPGFTILKILKIRGEPIEVLILSAGLSIAFLMLIGLFMSALLPLMNIFDVFNYKIMLAILGGLSSIAIIFDSMKNFRYSNEPIKVAFNKYALLMTIIFVIITFLSIIGAVSNNILLLLVAILLIVMTYGICSLEKNTFNNFHIQTIFIVCIALIFQTSLITKRLAGYDIHLETFVFKSTENRGYWVPPKVQIQSDTARFESVLSITVLPAIFSVFLNINAEIIFKLVYPLIYSIVPLILYRAYIAAGVEKHSAFLSILFFISSPTFFGIEPLSLMRQIIGQLFFALLIFVLLNEKISKSNRSVLFIIFSASLIVSHYALAYLFVFIAIFVFLGSACKQKYASILDIKSLLLLLTMTFAWYTFVSDAPLLKLQDDIRRIYYNFSNDIFNPEARGAQVATLVQQPNNFLELMHRGIFLIRNFLIAASILTLFLKKDKSKIDKSFILIAIACFILLVSCILIPDFGGILQPTRFYSLTMMVLSPFIVLGCNIVMEFSKTRQINFNKLGSFLDKDKSKWIKMVALILIISFLFDVGFVDHITSSYPESISLDSIRMKLSDDINLKVQYYSVFTIEHDISGATWLSRYKSEDIFVYSDENSKYHVLDSYGLIPLEKNYPLLLYAMKETDGYLYMSYMNNVEEIIVTPTISNTSMVKSFLDLNNKIFSNGGCDIYGP